MTTLPVHFGSTTSSQLVGGVETRRRQGVLKAGKERRIDEFMSHALPRVADSPDARQTLELPGTCDCNTAVNPR